jgi:hypothetical protein
MGWGRMLLLGNWGQQMDIEDQKSEIEELKQKVEANSGEREALSVRSRVSQLETENAELRLYLAALVRYLGNRGVLREDFRTMVEIIDSEDGQTDGGYKGKILK